MIRASVLLLALVVAGCDAVPSTPPLVDSVSPGTVSVHMGGSITSFGGVSSSSR
jgi:hypothetical protein